MRFGRETWSVQLPAGWKGWHDEECASMEAPTRLGALQVSAAFKDLPVTDEDLVIFAKAEVNASLDPVSFGPFVGLHLAHEEDGASWHRWYLRHGSQVLFITYNCSSSDRGLEDGSVIEVLASLSTEPARPPATSSRGTRPS